VKHKMKSSKPNPFAKGKPAAAAPKGKAAAPKSKGKK
jgi:hypothetical protein